MGFCILFELRCIVKDFYDLLFCYRTQKSKKGAFR